MAEWDAKVATGAAAMAFPRPPLPPSPCTEALRRMFPDATVPQPRSVVVTAWGKDPWALGSYSYFAKPSGGGAAALLDYEQAYRE